MLRTLVRFFAARLPLTAGLWLVALAFGLLAYSTLLPREGFPSVESPRAVANGRYLIEDREQVDLLVANQFGTAVIEFGDAITSQTVARDSSFSVFAEFRDGTGSDDALEALQVAMFVNDIPDELAVKFDAVDESKLLDQFDMLIAVSFPGQTSAEELERSAEALLPLLDADPSVESSEIQSQLFEGTSPLTGETVVKETDFNLFATVDTDAVALSGGASAAGSDGPVQFHPAIPIGVRAADGVDSLELRAAMERLLPQVAEDGVLADGFRADIAMDSAPQISRQISSLQSNAVAGIIAVAIVAFLLLSWRATIVTGVFILTALATTFAVLYLLGISLNTISLFGVILALGLLVDDAIVITESIDAARVEQRAAGGESDDLGIIDTAVSRVGSASISGTMTTVLVFAPLLTITGVLGDFIRIIPISVIVTLLSSLLLSFVFIPTATRLLVLRDRRSRAPLGPVIDRSATVVERWIGGRGRGVAAIGLSLVMTVVGLAVFAPRVGFNIFPAQDDSTEIAMEVDFRPGTTITDARAIALDINQQASAALGANLVSGFTFLGDDRTAFTQLNLTEIGDRPTAPTLVEETLSPLAAEFERARVTFSQISAGPPEPAFPFQAQVYHHDPATLVSAAEAVQAVLEGAQIERPDGTTFEVLETHVAFTDVIARRDGRRYLEVRARFDADDVSTITAATQTHVEEHFPASRLTELGLIPGSLQFDLGTESDNQESFASVPYAFGLALLLVLGLLVLQFRSATQWLLVLLAIPFSFFGVFGGLLLTGNVISFFVMVGLIGLIGIAVNNTILLTDYANQERLAGSDPRTAITAAVRHRFRPLLATSATTVAGLLPLSLTDPFWEALGMTIIFGLLSSTFLVLVSFPFFYLAMEWLRGRFVPPWRRAVPANPS